MNDGAADRWSPWFGPLALVLGLVAGLLGGVVVVLIAEGGGAAHTTTLTPGETDAATVIQDLGFVIAAWFLARQVGRVRPAMFGLRTASVRRSALIIVGSLLAFYALSEVWFSLLGSNGQEKELVKEIGGNGGTFEVLVACAVTCVVAPICEEFLFRGFVYRSLRNWRGVWPAALITGVLFGVVHGLSAPAVDLFPLAFLGIVLCFVYQRTGSLYPCIAMHVLNNAIAFGADEHWNWRTVELAAGALGAVVLVLACVRLASARWTPATD
jgi:hypothetical protein